MSVVLNRVRPGFYLDSVALMRIAAAVEASPGVERAALMIGTPANREILSEAGLLGPEGEPAGPDDLIFAVAAIDAEAAERALALAEARLDRPAEAKGGSGWRPHTIAAALGALPAANLALVSVPGPFAAAEARKALRRGLSVLLFSDNVPVDEEVALKREAAARGLLLMGPDAGTAWVAGVPLGFANAVPRGEIGIVAASGTGLQEVACLLAATGEGISHGLGVGGRDLSMEVGGLGALAALDLLADDPATRRVVLVSKPPAPEVARAVLDRLKRLGKPAVACFLGQAPAPADAGDVAVVDTLAGAAEAASGRGLDALSPAGWPPVRRGLVSGLFTGGTLAGEAAMVLARAKVAHRVVDFGDDRFTRGRPHPMIDPALRTAAVRDALADPSVGVVLVDVVLGYGAHPSPAAPLAAALAAAPATRPALVAHVVGTPGDPQGYAAQYAMLESAGALLAPSNAAAARLAIDIAGT